MTPYEILLQGPGKNAIGSDLLDLIEREIGFAAGRPLLICGDGDAFSAGLNLHEIISMGASGLCAFMRRLCDVCLALYHYPAPTVACVNGHAIAGGCVLALCCDHRVATSNPGTRIGLNEAALGVMFPPSILALCMDRVPRRFHEQVILAGDLFAPDRALALGLVDELTDHPGPVARERVEHLGRRPRAVYAAIKAELRGHVQRDPHADSHFEHHGIPIWRTEDVRRRMLAALGRGG